MKRHSQKDSDILTIKKEKSEFKSVNSSVNTRKFVRHRLKNIALPSVHWAPVITQGTRVRVWLVSFFLQFSLLSLFPKHFLLLSSTLNKKPVNKVATRPKTIIWTPQTLIGIITSETHRQARLSTSESSLEDTQ